MTKAISNPPFQTSKRHGGTRGADMPRLSSNTQGRFGRMFRGLPACECNDRDLSHLADAIIANLEPFKINNEDQRDDRGLLIPGATSEEEVDDEENFGIAAGYTYFGQFIDHDLTFDPASFLQKQNDPEGLVDFRTPRFDLDCLYGQGPDDQPYLYEDDELHMHVGRKLRFGDANAIDLPRVHSSNGSPRALIGDKRNDENVIVSQLQAGFIRFHNRVADVIIAKNIADNKTTTFGEVARIVRWHYQWCVLHDFLPTIIGTEMINKVLPHLPSESGDIHEHKPDLRFYHYEEDPFIPIEFTTAAYRFGHSMVRPIYRLNTHLGTEDDPNFIKDKKLIKDKQIAPTSLGRQFIFAAVANSGLNGFREFPETFAVDWNLFFGKPDPEKLGADRIQPAYKIDTSMVNPLGFLPEFSQPGPDGNLLTDKDGNPLPRLGATANLALRNLRRGQSMGLPSGQSVARAMGLTPLKDMHLRVGKANVDGLKNNHPITHYGHSFKDNAPLWFYILAEAQNDWSEKASKVMKEAKNLSEEAKKNKANAIPVQLGSVGGRIVAETFVGLLLGDRNSFLRQEPRWEPWTELCGGKLPSHFGILDLLKAGQST